MNTFSFFCFFTCIQRWPWLEEKSKLNMILNFLYVRPCLVPLSRGLWNIWPFVTGSCKTSYQPRTSLHSKKKKKVWERVYDHGSTGHSHQSSSRSASAIIELYVMPSSQHCSRSEGMDVWVTPLITPFNDQRKEFVLTVSVLPSNQG